MKKNHLAVLLAGAAAASVLTMPMTSCSSDTTDDLLTHKYNYDLAEYINLAEYKGLPAEGYTYEVTDEQVDAQILATLSYYSKLTDVTDRGAQIGDTVYIDYVGTIDGEEFEGSSEEDCEFTLGTDTFEFEDQLIGTYAGDHLSIDVTFPDPYPDYPEQAGKPVHFEIDVNTVCMQELPNYTDDFARAYLGYESIEDFETNMRKSLSDYYAQRLLEYIIGQTWNVVVENTEVIKYPEAEVEAMYNDMVSSNQAYASASGINFETFLSLTYKMTEDEFYEYARAEAESRIKEEMICYAIARAENIELSDEEYTVRATEYAVDYYELASLEAFEALYDKATIRQTIMIDMVQEKVAELASVTYAE